MWVGRIAGQVNRRTDQTMLQRSLLADNLAAHLGVAALAGELDTDEA